MDSPLPMRLGAIFPLLLRELLLLLRVIFFLWGIFPQSRRGRSAVDGSRAEIRG